MMRVIAKSPENIKTTDWLTRGMTAEQIAQKKKAAIEEAERELKERDVGTEIYELACILYKNKEYNLDWFDCVYLAEQAVKQGYRKQVEGEWIEHETAWGDVFYSCSVCGDERCSVDGSVWELGLNYCPNCGAKMRSIKQIFNEGGFESQAL